MFRGALFLPLTLDVLDGDPRFGTDVLSDAVHRVEQDARTAWRHLLGTPDAPVGTDLALRVRWLSLAVGGYVGTDEWSRGDRGHGDRVAGYQLWLEETLAEGDGAGFARAFAGYDEAIARAVLGAATRPTGAERPRPDTPPSETARAAAAGEGRSGTIAGWARQARAVTSRVRLTATRRRRGVSISSRHGTSSSRWSRHSRSAG